MLVLLRRTSFLTPPVFQSSYTLQLQFYFVTSINSPTRFARRGIMDSTMLQVGFEPPPVDDTSYEADALPTKPPWLVILNANLIFDIR